MFRSSPHRRTLVFPAIALLAATLLAASCSSDNDSTDSTDSAVGPSDTATTETMEAPASTETPGTTETSGDFDPYSQTLEWSECEYGECAEATVPIDYDDPSAGTTTIVLSRLASTDPDPIGTLFVNPGGPGASGLDLPGEFDFRAAPELLASYDIVGFDPRGVGQSNPVECLDDADLDQFQAADLDPDDPASVDAYNELAQAQGEACLANSPELARHVTTVETAKDLDVLRALVGDDEMYYMGFSYGTFLGTTYAALFPDRVGRMVLDGPEDPTLSESAKTLRTMEGFQLAFDDYAADCVANDCPLGSSVDEIEQQVVELFETAKAEPLPTDDPERPLTRPLAFYGIASPLYDQTLWPDLTESLAGGFEGDGTALLASADEYLGRVDGGYPENNQVIVAINCLDAQIAPPSDSPPTEDDFLAASSVFGEIAYASVASGCDQWPIQPTVTAPDYTAAGAAPIVVVGTTGDPATPFENAEKLAETLDSGVLLVRVGEGHTAYFSGNQCITETVNAYLIDGTVPDDGTECAETEPVDDTAPDDGQDVSLVVGEDILFAEWTECTWDGTALTLAAAGDGIEIDAATGDDGTITVTVSGNTEVTLSAVAEQVDTTLFVTGTATAADGTTTDASLTFDLTTCS